MSNVIWIDTLSGTWGSADEGYLVLVDLDQQAALDTLAGEPVDAASLLAYLEDASDSEIAAFGLTYGYPAAILREEDEA
jgi:hypothetical protein